MKVEAIISEQSSHIFAYLSQQYPFGVLKWGTYVKELVWTPFFNVRLFAKMNSNIKPKIPINSALPK
jgi:hypothetical protein